MPTISANDLSSYIDKPLPESDWLTVSQEQISAFGTLTLDEQFIHMDSEKAKATPFGGTIAHGFLVMSLLSHFAENAGLMLEGTQMGVNYGFDKVRFLTPVRSGSEIRCRMTLKEVTEKQPGQFLMKTLMEVEIKGEAKPALMAEWLTMQFIAQ